MVKVDDILKSMQEDMTKYEQEYNSITEQINTIISEYNKKIDELQQERIALQKEGNAKLQALEARKEQLSGMHKSLYDQYNKFKGTDSKDIVKDKKVAEKSNKKATEVVKNIPPKNDILSSEELSKLSEIVNTKSNSAEKPNVDENGNEIPEYLQDSYKK